MSIEVGAQRAGLLFASTSQASFIVPNGLAIGSNDVLVSTDAGQVYKGTVNVANVAPGIFSYAQNGAGEGVIVNGITGARETGSIGFSAIRGGDIVGEHDVMFAADGERIILRHIATDRSVFVRGALRAALWGQAQKPGRYDMMDVLGI